MAKPARGVLGIDIGEREVRVVRTATGLRTRRVLERHSEAIPDGPPQTRSARVAEALARLDLSGEEVVAALDAQDVSLRRLFLPFTEARKIDQVIGSEMEAEVPFDLERMLIDYQIVEKSASGTTLLAVAALKESIARLLEDLRAAGVDPTALDVDLFALFTFYAHFLSDLPEAKNLLLVDLDGRRARGIVVRDGGLLAARTVSRSDGSDDLWVLEFEKMLKTIDLSEGEEIHLYACGEGADPEALSSTLSLPLLSPRGKTSGDPGLTGVESPGPYAVAIGLALKRAAARGSRINFRKGPFVYGRVVAARRTQIVTIASLLIFLALLSVGNLYLRYSMKRGRLSELKGEIRSLFVQTFPQIKPGDATIIAQAQSQIAEMQRRREFLGIEEASPLVILKEITTSIPPEVAIDVSDLLIDGNRVRIEARTDSFESADRIKGALAKNAAFADTSVGDAKLTADGAHVSFRISAARKGAG